MTPTLARAKTAAHRMDDLIRDVLNYSRLVQQGLELHPVNVAALLRGIIATYPTFQAPQVHIRLAPVLLDREGRALA